MKTQLYILIILLNLGCIWSNSKINKTSVLTESSQSKNNQAEKTKIKNDQDELDLFIHELRNQPIQSLPYEKDSYLLKTNVFKGNYFNWLENLTINGRTNTHPILNNEILPFNSPVNSNQINNITKSYLDSYYYLLLNETNISSFHFHKRLKPINENIEIFLNKSIITKNENEIRGLLVKLNVFDIQNKKILNSYIIRITGIGVNDESFIEGFTIDKDYNIIMKSQTSVEGESTEIIKKIRINSNGSLSKEIINVKITSKEKGEIFIEEFSKEIVH